MRNNNRNLLTVLAILALLVLIIVGVGLEERTSAQKPVTHPDGSTTTSEDVSLGPNRSGTKETTKDKNGNKTKEETKDETGRVVQKVEYGENGTVRIWEYDRRGRLVFFVMKWTQGGPFGDEGALGREIKYKDDYDTIGTGTDYARVGIGGLRLATDAETTFLGLAIKPDPLATPNPGSNVAPGMGQPTINVESIIGDLFPGKKREQEQEAPKSNSAGPETPQQPTAKPTPKVEIDPKYKIEFKTSPGLNTETLTLPSGSKISINLPDDMSAGDTITGTVRTEVAGKDEKQRAKNQAELERIELQIGGQSMPATGKMFTRSIPANLDVKLDERFILLAVNGKRVCSVAVPLTQNPPLAPQNPQLPTCGQMGRNVVVKDHCDGIIAPTDSCSIGGTQLQPLAESPRMRVMQNTSEVPGLTEIKYSEQGKEVTGPFQNLGVKLTSPNTNLLRGQKTTLEVIASVQGIQQDVSLDLVNDTPGIVSISGGDNQHFTIHPTDVQGDGTYKQNFTVTANQAGAWGATATVSCVGGSGAAGPGGAAAAAGPGGTKGGPPVGLIIPRPKPTPRPKRMGGDYGDAPDGSAGMDTGYYGLTGNFMVPLPAALVPPALAPALAMIFAKVTTVPSLAIPAHFPTLGSNPTPGPYTKVVDQFFIGPLYGRTAFNPADIPSVEADADDPLDPDGSALFLPFLTKPGSPVGPLMKPPAGSVIPPGFSSGLPNLSLFTGYADCDKENGTYILATFPRPCMNLLPGSYLPDGELVLVFGDPLKAFFITSVWASPTLKPDIRRAYWNMLFDLNQDGKWAKTPSFTEWVCEDIPVTLTPGGKTDLISPPFTWPVAGGGPFGPIIFPIWARNMVTSERVKDTVLAEPVVIFNNWNTYAVGNSPTRGTQFTIDEPYLITTIEDYHWNYGKGTVPGKEGISLKDSHGTVFGPWPVLTSSGQGGVPNAEWECFPGVTIPAGTYTVIDPDPATWSQNGASETSGFSKISGRATSGNWDGRGIAGGFSYGEVEDYFLEFRPVGQVLPKMKKHHSQEPSAPPSTSQPAPQQEPVPVEVRREDFIHIQCQKALRAGAQLRCNMTGPESGTVVVLLVPNAQSGGQTAGELRLTRNTPMGNLRAAGFSLSAVMSPGSLTLDLQQAPQGSALLVFAEPLDQKRRLGTASVGVAGGLLLPLQR